MRIRSIELRWFRGAGECVALDCALKSVVVYGENAAGKSSFVDAIEYAINDGKIAHLSHEYSGSRQEKGVVNTHTPPDRTTSFSITFKDGSHFSAGISRKGIPQKSGTTEMNTWDYRRTVLRQDEISRFIHSSKGNKYSDLLPLLGLGGLEIAAENLRQLARTIEAQSQLRERQGAANQSASKSKQILGTAEEEELIDRLAALYHKHCPLGTAVDVLARCNEVIAALRARIEKLSSENSRHLVFQSIANIDFGTVLNEIRDVNARLAGSLEPLVAEKLQVLEAAHLYSTKLADEAQLTCPACGQSIGKSAFQAHVNDEQLRLTEIGTTFAKRRQAISSLIDMLKMLQIAVAKKEVHSWAKDLREGALKANFEWLDQLDPEALRLAIVETELTAVEANAVAIIAAAKDADKETPPDVKDLSADLSHVEAIKSAFETQAVKADLAKIENLINFVNAVEKNVRGSIRSKSRQAIGTISSDIGDMWGILHPYELIEDVHLYLPDDDKAIDIALKFHGKDQHSPRLTLSEGYRNSLGLCIFLALAKREAASERPLILDDVVVSFDRNHRGMIIELLQRMFSDRQVIVFTHDRDWFADLRYQLDEKEWNFRRLMPFQTPELGIRFAHKTNSFDDARNHLKGRPDSAGNDARKIMDVELGNVAEKLELRLPFVRGEKNDHRMCGDFLERLTADGKKCLQIKEAGGYVIYSEGLSLLDTSRRLLVTWGNKGSHSQDLVRNEATKLIDACESALDVFKCRSCGKSIWFSEAAEWKQCQCGDLRWRHSKA